MSSSRIGETYHQNEEGSTASVKKYTIGEVAKLTGSTVITVRHYDEIGLLKPAEVTSSRYRLYTTEEIWRLKLILTLRQLGFGTEDIRNMISGEVSVATVIDWQIEAVDAQILNLTTIKSILQQAKQSDHGEESLRYMYNLVESQSTSIAERKKLILEKMKAAINLEKVSDELINMIFEDEDTILKEDNGKLSMIEKAAIDEMERLLEDPQLIADIRNPKGNLMRVLRLPSDDAAAWLRIQNEMWHQITEYMKNQSAPSSPVVQASLEEYVKLFAKLEKTPFTMQYFRQFVENSLYFETDRLERFHKLLDTLFPLPDLISKANSFFLQVLQWRHTQLEVEDSFARKKAGKRSD